MSGIVSCHSKEGHHIRKALMGHSEETGSCNVLDKLGSSSHGRYTRLPCLSLPGLGWGRSLESREVAFSPQTHRGV